MARIRRCVVFCAVVMGGVAASAPAARAQTRCFQKVGAYNVPPNWWDVGTSPLGSLTGSFVDDPRWRGATVYSHVSDTANFKVLVETTATGRNLVMSWHVRADPPPATGPDSDRRAVPSTVGSFTRSARPVAG